MATFPDFLRGALKASKSRTISEGYRQNQPFSGTPYTQRLSDDNPVIYDLQFAFETGYKTVFYMWLYDSTYTDGIAGATNNEFTIPIESEWGVQNQTARFTEGGFPQLVSEQAGVFTYQAQVVIRSLTNPYAGYSNEIAFVIDGDSCGNLVNGQSLLDYAMNQDFPSS